MELSAIASHVNDDVSGLCKITIFLQEGSISRSLIRNGIMYRQPCRDTGNKKEQFTYRVRKVVM